MTSVLVSEALELQLRALAADQYEFGIFVVDKMIRRVWPAEEALASARWMRYMNVRGAHIYLRPAGTDFVLLDDATTGALAAMRRDGLSPAAVVETSPANHQVWLRFPDQLGRDIATSVAQVLAHRYQCDMGSADFRHLGRAAGFTNRKRKHRDENGRFPWIRLIEHEGDTTPRSVELIAEGRKRFERKEAERAEAAAAAREANGRAGGYTGPFGAVEFYRNETDRIWRRYGDLTDPSRADAAAARKMAFAGFSQREVVVVLASSGDVQRRKPGHAQDYAERTAAWAFGQTHRRTRPRKAPQRCDAGSGGKGG